jgi:hypothetical protein
MRRFGVWLGAGLLSFCVCSGAIVQAASLEDQLTHLISSEGNIKAAESDIGVPINNFFSTAPAIIERLAVRATDFPAPPTSAGFTFQYNPELGIFEKASSSLGPVFGERAETVGRNRLNVAVNYLHAVVDDLDGEKVSGDPSKSGLADVFSGIGFTQARDPNNPNSFDTSTNIQFTTFELVYDIARFTATYGVTQNWDVNILVPLISTTLNVEGLRTLRFTKHEPDGFTATGLCKQPPGTPPGTPCEVVAIGDRRFRLNANATGVGDILLRTKYRLGTELRGFKFAGILTLRAPSGDEANFQSLGDWTVTPALVVSRPDGLYDYHANLGMEINGDDLERSRVRYGLGATLQPMERAAASIDIIGHSGVSKDHFDLIARGASTFGAFVPGIQSTEILSGKSTLVHAFVPRTDIVDLSGIVKVNVYGNAIAYGGAIVPLTDDGLHASVIPVGGLEFTF